MSNPCVSRLYTVCGRERFWSSVSQPTPSFWCFWTPSQSPASQRSINKSLPFQFVEAYTDDRCIILCSNNHSRRIKHVFLTGEASAWRECFQDGSWFHEISRRCFLVVVQTTLVTLRFVAGCVPISARHRAIFNVLQWAGSRWPADSYQLGWGPA